MKIFKSALRLWLNPAFKVCCYLFITLALLLGFQNCGSTSTGSSFYSAQPKADQTSVVQPACIPAELCNPSPESVSLSSGVQAYEVSAFRVGTMAQYVVDVSGNCDLGNYPQALFSYRVSSSSYNLDKTFAADEVKCESNGRFHFQIAMDPVAVASLKALDLAVTMSPVDSAGALVRINGTANILKRYIVYAP